MEQYEEITKVVAPKKLALKAADEEYKVLMQSLEESRAKVCKCLTKCVRVYVFMCIMCVCMGD